MKGKLLNFKQLKSLIYSKSPIDKANVMQSVLKDRVIINNKVLYILNSNLVYVNQTTSYENELITLISETLNDSYKKLCKEEYEELEAIKNRSDILQIRHIRNYFPQIISKLTNNDIVFDYYFDEIHFINGYYSLRSNKFYPRREGKHYITLCIEYPYEKPEEKEKQKVLDIISKIYEVEEDRNAMIQVLGSSLTGRTNMDQYLLFLVGEGSSGKSTVLEITNHAIGMYFQELKDDTFVEGNPNINKILNTYDKAPYIRVTWVNEPKDKKFDSSLYKSFAEGKCNTVKLYGEKSHVIRNYSKCFLTANNPPNIKADSGTIRRTMAYKHTSKFVDEIKDVDESNHI